MPLDTNQIDSLIETNLPSQTQRGISALKLRTILKLVTAFVKDAASVALDASKTAASEVAVTIANQFKGAYSVGFSYVKGDGFTFRGSTYAVIAPFTAAAQPDRSKLIITARGTYPTGLWQANTWYFMDDIATQGANSYRRLTDGMSGAIFDPTQWELFAQGGSVANGVVTEASLSTSLTAKLFPFNYSTPLAVQTAKINDLNSFTTGNNSYPVAHTFIVTSATHGRATLAGYVTQFQVSLNNPEVGRTVAFYILKEVTTGNYQVTYVSGNIPAELSGVNVLNLDKGVAEIGLNDVVGVKVNCISTNNSIRYQSSGGPAISSSIRVTTALTLGSTYTGTAESASYRFGVSATISDRNLVVAEDWGNKANGYLQLDSNARAGFGQLPALLNDSGVHTETPVTTFLTDKGNAIVRQSGGRDTYTSNEAAGSEGIGSANFTAGKIIVNWKSSSPGFANAGLLTEVRVGSVQTSVSGSMVQAWIVRPLNLGVSSFAVVATVGEIDASVSGRWHVFRGLAIPVQAGDMIAVRPIGVDLPFRTGSAGQVGYVNVRATVTDMTLGGVSSFVGSTGGEGSRTWPIEADIITTSLFAGNSAFSLLRLDSLGNIPNRIGRAVDMYWAGKKIVAVGTSITAGGNATNLRGYIYQAGQALYANMVNNAQGSSGICWNGTRNLSLSATQAELTTAFGAGWASQSYEVRVLGQNADLYLFDHHYNDGGYPIGTIDSTDRATFYGAYNHVIGALLTEKPSAQIMFITPHSYYSPTNTTNGTPSAGTTATRNAILALGLKYKAPVLDFTETMQLSAAQAPTFLPDTVHPIDEWHTRAGRRLYKFIQGL